MPHPLDILPALDQHRTPLQCDFSLSHNYLERVGISLRTGSDYSHRDCVVKRRKCQRPVPVRIGPRWVDQIGRRGSAGANKP